MSGKLIELDGQRVAFKGDMISLTDLWRAGGQPEGKRPDDWKKDAGNRAFLEHVALVVNAPVEGIWKGTRGKTGKTLAHWHIAMSYARYLDPAFAVRCNEIVRNHMERNIAPASFPVELMEMVKRTDGIVRMLAHKVTTIEKAVADNSHEPAAFTITVEPKKRSAA
jgi:hypothetical protein